MQQNGYFSLKKMETFFSEDKLSLSLLGSTDLSPDALWNNLKDKVMLTITERLILTCYRGLKK